MSDQTRSMCHIIYRYSGMQQGEPQPNDIGCTLFNAMFLIRNVDLRPVFLTDLKKIRMFAIPLYRPDGGIVVLEAYDDYATPLSQYVTSLFRGVPNRFVVLKSLNNQTQENFVHLKLVLCPNPLGKTKGRLLVRGKEGPMNFTQLQVRNCTFVMRYKGEILRPYQLWFLTQAEEDQVKQPFVDPFEALVSSMSQCSAGNDFILVFLCSVMCVYLKISLTIWICYRGGKRANRRPKRRVS